MNVDRFNEGVNTAAKEIRRANLSTRFTTFAMTAESLRGIQRSQGCKIFIRGKLIGEDRHPSNYRDDAGAGCIILAKHLGRHPMKKSLAGQLGTLIVAASLLSPATIAGPQQGSTHSLRASNRAASRNSKAKLLHRRRLRSPASKPRRQRRLLSNLGSRVLRRRLHLKRSMVIRVPRKTKARQERAARVQIRCRSSRCRRIRASRQAQNRM